MFNILFLLDGSFAVYKIEPKPGKGSKRKKRLKLGEVK